MGLHRDLLQWKLSNWFIALFIALAVGTLSIAVTVEQPESWFLLTCLFVGISTIWSIGSWLTSNLLRDLKPDSWIRQRKRRDLPPIPWTPGYATAILASNSAGDR